MYDEKLGQVVTTVHQAYLDRVSRDSDIREYLPLLYNTARSYPGARILELGVRKGNSTLALLAGAEESGGHVWSADITDVIREDMRPWAGCRLWTFTCGDDMNENVQNQLPREVDVLFIDTSHEYGHTLRELEVYMPRLAPGGVALFHDTRFVFFARREDWDGSPPPVGLALDKYCKRTGKTWIDLPGHYGMGVLRG
jgi:predicted O-methyltransferase YrrM